MSAAGTERAPWGSVYAENANYGAWLCRTCAWGFPESIGYSCSRIEGHICSRVVVACEEYRRKCDRSQGIQRKGDGL